MKDFAITKKLFFLTLFLLIINALMFSYDHILGFVVLGNGVAFFLPIVVLLALIDRFYFKNKTKYFFGIILILLICLSIGRFLSQAYLDSVIQMI